MGGRNPRECAVAKIRRKMVSWLRKSRNPRECAVAKAALHDGHQRTVKSQPARMRCGKECDPQAPAQDRGRNPRECAVAKGADGQACAVCTGRNPRECAVAKIPAAFEFPDGTVATRANALWQRWTAPELKNPSTSQPARMRCGKVAYSGGKDSDCISRNPRECAVAKQSGRNRVIPP